MEGKGGVGRGGVRDERKIRIRAGWEQGGRKRRYLDRST